MSILDWLRALFQSRDSNARPEVESSAPAPVQPSTPDPAAQARSYLDKVQAKLRQLAADFNAGAINRAQFQNLYAHYQREVRNVQSMIEVAPGSEGWKGAVTEGQSILIRRKHLARAEGYAIYENHSGMPVSTLGQFDLDPALLVPMLSSYRSATQEIFGAGMRSTQIEGGRWLCFVPGELTTLLAVFTQEPAGRQLEFVEELHRTFEEANQRTLSAQPLDKGQLIFPHEYFLGQWRR